MFTNRFSAKITLFAQALVLVFGLSVFVPVPGLAAPTAATPSCTTGLGADPILSGATCSKSNSAGSDLFGPAGIFKAIANTLIYIVGAVAVLFLIVGGLRYVTSNGDPKSVTAAKDTILYSLVGVAVAIVSFAAVRFVVTSLK